MVFCKYRKVSNNKKTIKLISNQSKIEKKSK